MPINQGNQTCKTKPEGKNSLDQPLMNPHLERIPSLTPLTTGRLTRRHLQVLRR